eukprot:scaffold182587_cov83-Cyclotella_meneghiniana.AAC.1
MRPKYVSAGTLMPKPPEALPDVVTKHLQRCYLHKVCAIPKTGRVACDIAMRYSDVTRRIIGFTMTYCDVLSVGFSRSSTHPKF